MHPLEPPGFDVRFSFDHLSVPNLLQAILPAQNTRMRPETRSALAAGFQHPQIQLASTGRELRCGFALLGQSGHLAGKFGEEQGLAAIGRIDAIRRQEIAGGRHLLELTEPNPATLAEPAPELPGNHDGPVVRLQPGNIDEPGIQFAANCTLFARFSQAIHARVVKKGAQFGFSYDADEVGFDLSCNLTEGDFRAEGDFGLQIRGELRLREPKSGAELGSIHVDAPLHGQLTLQLAKKSFEAALTGHLHWHNLKLAAPKLVLREIPVDFADFRRSIIAALRPHAFAIFKPAFAEADAFHAAANDGQLKTGQKMGISAESLAHAMRLVFAPTPTQLTYGLLDLGYSTHQIAGALKNVARVAPDATAKQLHGAQCPCNQISSALRAAYDAKPDIIAQSLRAIGFGHQPIAEALRLGANFTARETARGLRAATFDAGDIALALRDHFHAPAAVVAQALHEAGIKSREAIRALPPAFETNREETEALLLAAGYSPRDVRGAAEKSVKAASW